MSTPSSPFETYQCYLAMKMHFTTESYNYFKYNGKVNSNQNSFENRKDRNMFYALSKKKDIQKYILANMLENPKIWVGDLLSDKAEQRYKDFLKIEESLSYYYKTELKQLNEDFDSNFAVKNGQRPNLLKLYNTNKISIHTMTILSKIVDYIPYWDKKLQDNILWPQNRIKIQKFQPFLQIDEKKFKELTRSLFS